MRIGCKPSEPRLRWCSVSAGGFVQSLPAATHSVARTTASSAAKVIAVIAATPVRSVRTVLLRRCGLGDRQRSGGVLPIDGVLSADHVTYDCDADESRDYNEVVHTPYIIKIFLVSSVVLDFPSLKNV